MSDVTITRNDELMVFEAEGESEAGVDYVDAYVAPQLIAVDVGRVILPTTNVEDFIEGARRRDLTWEIVDQLG